MKTNSLVLLAACLVAVQTARGADWQVIASPNGTNPVNELHGVAAVADNDVWAVGASYNTEFTLSQSLIEHWNGTTWSVIPSPNPSSSLNVLNAVAAVAANDVWAVGIAPTGTSNILIEHWNGAVWSVVPGPSTSMTLSSLSALAVISANDIWAVGSGRLLDEDATVTIHWDGTSWSLIPSPNVGPEVDNTLHGITAIAANDVWAVGTQQPTSLTDPHTLTLHWNGSAWSIVPSANDGGNTVGNHLLAAAAASSIDVWAVGYSEFGTLSLHWNGVSWSVVPTPPVRGGEPLFLNSALALPNGNIWSVGEFFQTNRSRSRTLTEFWNGTTWTVVRSANRGSQHNSLASVTVTPNGTLWAVGLQYVFPNENSLVLRKLP
jgi:hypothetical protein